MQLRAGDRLRIETPGGGGYGTSSTVLATAHTYAMTRCFSFWRDADPTARRALIAASLGWMLDAFDVMLYALVLPSLRADLSHRRADVAGGLQSLTLLASAAGGLLFGVSPIGAAARAR